MAPTSTSAPIGSAGSEIRLLNVTTELFGTSADGRSHSGRAYCLDVGDEREVGAQRADVLRRGQPEVEDDRARGQLDGAVAR